MNSAVNIVKKKKIFRFSTWHTSISRPQNDEDFWLYNLEI